MTKQISRPIAIAAMAMLVMAVFFTAFSATKAEDQQQQTHVKVETSYGDFVIALNSEASPNTVANFLSYVESGHYTRTIFHRVVPGFVIQGGGYSRYFNERPTKDPVAYEGDNGLSNVRGSVAMARTMDPNSAAAQWYVNLKDNPNLDHLENDLGVKHGYTVFGRVVSGMNVVDRIGSVATGPGGPFPGQVPVEEILLNEVSVTEWSPEAAEASKVN